MLNHILFVFTNFFKVVSEARKKWVLLFGDPTYRVSLLLGILVFVSSYALTVFVSVRNDLISYSSVGDLFLDIFPTYNLEFLFTYGIYSLVLYVFLYVVLIKPESAPFALKTYGLLFIFRSAFVSLTHFGPPVGFFYEEISNIGGGLFSNLIFKNDLFFSGHTAIPFLAFLIFKDSYIFKWIQFIGSIIMGITVLLMHVHYSIDVFSAFFITFGIYSISLKLFQGLNVRFVEKINNSTVYTFTNIFNSQRERTLIQEQKIDSPKLNVLK